MGRFIRGRKTEGEEVFVEVLKVRFEEVWVCREDRRQWSRGDGELVDVEGRQDL